LKKGGHIALNDDTLSADANALATGDDPLSTNDDAWSEIDKPNSAAFGWRRLETDYPFGCRWFRVRHDLLRWPDGRIAPYVYVEGVSAVWVVPVTTAGRIVLIRQFRYTMDDWCWEVPAGGFHDFDGSPLELARQELVEEVGGTSDDWCYIGSFHPGNSIIDATYHIVLARDVRLDRKPHREPSEIIEVHAVSVEKALDMARGGEMGDGLSALALLRCENLLLRK
jgi:ADP-ribose pyrophosphatase